MNRLGCLLTLACDVGHVVIVAAVTQNRTIKGGCEEAVMSKRAIGHCRGRP